ncbi:MAG: LD-carboxypeptidase [Proteobacteria bacterium]|nr:LD-carboxypeptidase [Pseudomonadota bacterium]
MSARTFYVYAPSGHATDPAAVHRAVALLEARGARVVLDDSALERHQRFAGDDDARLAAVMRAAASGADVAVAVRGGYGWTRLLPRIDFRVIARAPTTWLGHSDFTAFQLAMLARTGRGSLAGPMAGYDFGAEAPSAFTLEHCFRMLDTDADDAGFATQGPDGEHAGTLWGGNLAMVASLAGTPYWPGVRDGILFLEDVGEHPYRIERMLYQLHLAGCLDAQRAIVLGAFTEYRLFDHDAGYDLASVVEHLRARVAVPIYTGLPFGHVRDKLTLPVGGHATLAVRDGQATLHVAVAR